ncbi:hypothetical protein SAMN04515654_12165 [Halanaerobium congolense]|uniref:Uncharacterized protein n=1 Tax=Halanaerobium congolense TaxID=54121 RepID=A0A1G8PYA9_9FIRM|nr:hypothetical protein [Halanaerobium congolense]SDI97215.1 hypothetical protein SAMN04515654_12165 [Halanaerobium congolense]SES92094.1 hypothetical protein SAMN04515653_10465 [Halanaerobium congolense]
MSNKFEEVFSEHVGNPEEYRNIVKSIMNHYKSAGNGMLSALEFDGVVTADYMLGKAKALNDPELIKMAEKYKKALDENID